ncbi:aspartyl protease family protein [Mucilaginibacter sp. FT3.2]|uniref:aspartyl protease family protein n=1 Tax=Mucilaginibacter sp. FT3.2 TaxID=2723090 RepID=UPI00161B86D7|nr:pepsin/retropepsin-like aspartic protease family protein [Mucilaginibacter sp. FT3.2]MBB6229943.1 hypothetical protein [Mucilaginibacter sp. FT3.2]
MMILLLMAGWQKGECSSLVSVNGITFKNAVRSPDPDPSGDFNTLIVPIKRAGNLIIVEAQIDSVAGNFVLDTGAPYLVLNATYFRDMPHIAEQESAGLNGSAPGSFTTEVHNFNILDLHYPRLTADVTDLSAIENGKNIKILGLLGTRLFNKLAITVDLFRNTLYIHKLNDDGEIPLAEKAFHDPWMVTPFKYMNDIIFIKGAANNNTMWFAFDSGAETNLMDYDRVRKLLPGMQVISRTKTTGVGGSSSEVIYARFDTLTIGGRRFIKNRVLLTNLDKMGKAYGHSVDGILGYDFFIRGIFTINFVKKEFEMYIYTNQ